MLEGYPAPPGLAQAPPALQLAPSGQTPVDPAIAEALLKQSFSGGPQDFRSPYQGAAKIVQALLGAGMRGDILAREESAGQEIESSIAGLDGVNDSTKSVLGVLARDPKNRAAVADMIVKIQERNETRAAEGAKVKADQKFQMDLANRKAGLLVPTTRRFLEGGQEVEKEFDPGTRTWKEISRAPRFQDKTDLQKDAASMGLKPGTPEYKEFIAAARGKMKFSMTFDENGRPIIEVGAGTKAEGLGKRAAGEAQVKLQELGTNIQQLNAMREMYRPGYQTIGEKWEGFKSQWRANLGIKFTDEERSRYSDFVKFRAEGAQLFANTLKALSGVAVNPTEYKRAEAWIPNPGTTGSLFNPFETLFSGDDPIRMAVKTERFMDFTQKAIAKYRYILANPGADISNVSVDSMPGIMRKRASELAAKFKEEKGLDDDALKRAVVRQLDKEFGLAQGLP
ncbi:MAG: hypothetical protein A3E78_09275 [Alphaproteobacteria bacterium RIFCSPHIGHO2_12_FULL_63_12]|nr:MAG: hypothetical protein A3E78_09275 [Alphaproteobacteria bacterium RIFCSPHIGHO2_12_FULL_63_12]